MVAAPSAPDRGGPGVEQEGNSHTQAHWELTFLTLVLHPQVAALGRALVSKEGRICCHLACLLPLTLAWEEPASQQKAGTM